MFEKDTIVLSSYVLLFLKKIPLLFFFPDLNLNFISYDVRSKDARGDVIFEKDTIISFLSLSCSSSFLLNGFIMYVRK